jgi:hypothetical protein
MLQRKRRSFAHALVQVLATYTSTGGRLYRFVDTLFVERA